jgi:hypothetical protein
VTRAKRHAEPPENGKRFQKGVSGNPGGMPKWVGDVKRLCTEHTEEAVAVLLDVMRNGKKDRDRLGAAQYLLDRAHGKPVQAIAGDPDGAPVSLTGLTVTFVKPEPDSSISSQA